MLNYADYNNTALNVEDIAKASIETIGNAFEKLLVAYKTKIFSSHLQKELSIFSTTLQPGSVLSSVLYKAIASVFHVN